MIQTCVYLSLSIYIYIYTHTYVYQFSCYSFSADHSFNAASGKGHEAADIIRCADALDAEPRTRCCAQQYAKRYHLHPHNPTSLSSYIPSMHTNAYIHARTHTHSLARSLTRTPSLRLAGGGDDPGAWRHGATVARQQRRGAFHHQGDDLTAPGGLLPISGRTSFAVSCFRKRFGLSG